MTGSGLDAHLRLSGRSGFSLDTELRIPPGRTVALLGPNGAGKSTTVQALAGLTPLEGGRISLGGRVLDDPAAGVFVPAEERRIGVVFQDYILFPHLTVAENISFALRSRRVPRRSVLAATREWEERLGLVDLTDRKPRHLSGGQAQRVALARALIGQPDLLLLDEPLAALDASTRVESRRSLADYLESFPGPRLLITHEPTEAFLLAEEVHVIEDGSITQVGTADDIRLRPRTQYIADLAGSNLIAGTAAAGRVTAGAHLLHVGDTHISGPVLATIHPRAISLHLHEPEGSPRNTWQTALTRVEHYGDRVRVQTGDPLPLAAEITPNAEQALHLAVGSVVWLSIKATEIRVEAD